MKTNPYVAIHCWKALSLRIVRRPEKIICIKGPVFKSYIKFSAFTAHLPLKVLDFFKVLSRHAAYFESIAVLQIIYANKGNQMRKR